MRQKYLAKKARLKLELEDNKHILEDQIDAANNEMKNLKIEQEKL